MTLILTIDGVPLPYPEAHDKNWAVNASAVAQALANAVESRLKLSGGTMIGQIVLVGAPTIGLHPATKDYVDAAMLGLRAHTEVRLATTANVNLASALANGQTLDGQTIATGDRILVKNQTAAAENGIYVAPASGAASRAADADTYAELFQAFVSVTAGTAGANTGWLSTTTNSGTIGTTAVTFARFSSSGPLGTAATLDSGTADANLPTNALLKATVRDYTKQQNFAEATLTDGATIAWDLDTQQVAKLTLTASGHTLQNPTHMKAGGTYLLSVIQDGTGGHTLIFDTAYLFPNGVAPTLSTAAGSVTEIAFRSNGTVMRGGAQGPFSA